MTADRDINLWPHLTPPIASNPVVEAKIDDWLARMSLARKVGQMIQPEIKFITPKQVKDFHIGSVLNGGGSIAGQDSVYASLDEWLSLADAFYQASVDDSDGGVVIPIIWGTDSMHGASNIVGATLFPHNIGLGAMRNPELVQQIAAVTAKETLLCGVDWVFAPTLTVVRDDRWGRTYEGLSEHPDLVASYAPFMVSGLQGQVNNDTFFADDKVLATAKHFIGDGGTENGSDQGDNKATEAELAKVHGAGYRGALNAGVQAVMASYNSWHGDKLHGEHYFLTQVLKQQMGFDGLLVGDWNGHGQVAGGSNDNAKTAINSGVDIVMVPEDWQALYHNTIAQVEAGDIALSRIDDAVRRILRVKYRMGQFAKVKPSNRPASKARALLGCAEHRAVARQAVRESLVLLKNQANVLPINPCCQILVAGDGAHNIGKQAGGWSLTWQGLNHANQDFIGATSIWDGIAEQVKRASGKAVLSESGQFEPQAFHGDKPDIAIVVFGENPYAEKHGDLDSLAYQPHIHSDWQLLKSFKQQGIPTVSVFLGGRPLWLNRELNQSDAFVAAWLPGSEGQGIADVLLTQPDGQVQYDFVGKLSYSWPKQPMQSPLNIGDDHYDPLFPYGFGLSYQDQCDLTDALPEQSSTVANNQTIKLFTGQPMPPWQVIISNVLGEKLTQQGFDDAAVNGLSMTSVEKDLVGGARKLIFTGECQASFSLQATVAVDMADVLSKDRYLQFEVKGAVVGVKVGVSCVDDNRANCNGDTAKAELADYCDLQTLSDWQLVQIPVADLLSCELDLSQLKACLILEYAAQDNETTLFIANVALVK